METSLTLTKSKYKYMPGKSNYVVYNMNWKSNNCVTAFIEIGQQSL